MKKYIIIAASALVAMCACTKTEVNTPDEQINFAPAAYTAQTKADTGGHEGHSAVPGNFGVYAWFTPTSGTANQTFMSNVSVTPAGETAAPYYWPKTGTVDFVGYYPYGTCWFGVTSNPKTASKYVAPEQVIIPASDTASDLMYTDEAIGYDQNPAQLAHYYAGVPMLFHHALSQLTVNVRQNPLSITVGEGDAAKTTYWEIKVTSIKMYNIQNKGKVEIAVNETTGATTVPTTGYWTLAETPAKYEKTWNSSSPLTKSFTVYSDFENFLVMPQAIVSGLKTGDGDSAKDNGSQRIDVTYTITTTRSWESGFSVTETVNATLPFYDEAKTSTNNISKWEMGKSYIYNLVFTPTDSDDPSKVKITFDPAVVDWVDGGSGTITE